MTLSRDTENISTAPQKMSAKIAIDEWGVPGYPSVIEYVGLRKPDGSEIHGTLDKKSTARHPSWTTKEVTVEPGQKVRTFSKSVEYRHASDLHALALTNPTKDPEVELEVSPTLEAAVGFTHRAPTALEAFAGKKTLKGTLLPSQLILFQWWPKP